MVQTKRFGADVKTKSALGGWVAVQISDDGTTYYKW